MEIYLADAACAKQGAKPLKQTLVLKEAARGDGIAKILGNWRIRGGQYKIYLTDESTVYFEMEAAFGCILSRIGEWWQGIIQAWEQVVRVKANEDGTLVLQTRDVSRSEWGTPRIAQKAYDNIQADQQKSFIAEVVHEHSETRISAGNTQNGATIYCLSDSLREELGGKSAELVRNLEERLTVQIMNVKSETDALVQNLVQAQKNSFNTEFVDEDSETRKSAGDTQMDATLDCLLDSLREELNRKSAELVQDLEERLTVQIMNVKSETDAHVQYLVQAMSEQMTDAIRGLSEHIKATTEQHAVASGASETETLPLQCIREDSELESESCAAASIFSDKSSLRYDMVTPLPDNLMTQIVDEVLLRIHSQAQLCGVAERQRSLQEDVYRMLNSYGDRPPTAADDEMSVEGAFASAHRNEKAEPEPDPSIGIGANTLSNMSSLLPDAPLSQKIDSQQSVNKLLNLLEERLAINKEQPGSEAFENFQPFHYIILDVLRYITKHIELELRQVQQRRNQDCNDIVLRFEELEKQQRVMEDIVVANKKTIAAEILGSSGIQESSCNLQIVDKNDLPSIHEEANEH